MAQNKQQQEIKEITEKLEKGVKELFESERYKEFLNTMSKFHGYSLNNNMLITMQKPEATLVAGYNAWVKEHERHVKKGEKGIRIIAPVPYKKREERTKVDPDTNAPVLDANNKPIKEVVEVKHMGYKLVSVFDVSQTEGKEIPSLGVNELLGNVEDYDNFFDALKRSCPVPISFEQIEGMSKGYYHLVDKRIAIKEGMSEAQNVKTLIHEMAHQKLHDRDVSEESANLEKSVKEVEAESIAYVICQHYGIDTADYSFGYLAGWSRDKDTPELQSSLDRIRKAADEMITDIDKSMELVLAEQKLETVEKTENVSVLPEGKVRYTVTETSDAFSVGEDFAVMDAKTGDYAKSEDGRVFTFPTEEEADAFIATHLTEENAIVGEVDFENGEHIAYTSKEEYLKCVHEEIEYASTSGFRFHTLSTDPELRKAVDDEVYNIYGETNPHSVEYYQNLSEKKAASISFYVAECMEFTGLGEYHEGLTLTEAMDLYEKIPSDRMNAGKGIGFDLQDGSDFAGCFDLMKGNRVLDDTINSITHYRNSPLVQQAINDCIEELRERMGERQSDIEQAAYRVGEERYLFMQVASDVSWDFTLYGKDYQEIDGGQIGNVDMSFEDARNDILESYGLMHEKLTAIDPDVLEEQVQFNEALSMHGEGIAKVDYVLQSDVADRIEESMDIANVSREQFSQAQMDVIVEAAQANVPLSSLLNPELPPEQMKFALEKMQEGYNVERIFIAGKQTSIVDHPMTNEEIAEVKRQIQYGDIPKLIYSSEQWKEIEMGMKRKLDVSAYANPKYSAGQMKEIRLGLDKGIEVSTFASPDFSDKQMREIRRGVEAGLDVSSYAKPENSVQDMRKSFFSLKDEANALKNVIEQPEADKDTGLYRYYSTQRPVMPGSFPGKPEEIHNFDTREKVCGGQMEAWGYLEYKQPLSPKEMSDYELKPAVAEAVAKEQPSFALSEKKSEKQSSKKPSLMENLRRKQAQIADSGKSQAKEHEKEVRV